MRGVRINNVSWHTEHGCLCNVGLLVACMGQHVPGPLNHLSGGVITALWDATQPSNAQGARQRRHLLRKYSLRGIQGGEHWLRGGWSGWGRRQVGMAFGNFEVNLFKRRLTKQYCWVSVRACVKGQGWRPGFAGEGWWRKQMRGRKTGSLSTSESLPKI